MPINTPLEISDYKRKWKMSGGFAVVVHSDLDWKGKDWCRRNLERQQWSFDKWTGVYEHTFWFEAEAVANRFKKDFNLE